MTNYLHSGIYTDPETVTFGKLHPNAKSLGLTPEDIINDAFPVSQAEILKRLAELPSVLPDYLRYTSGNVSPEKLAAVAASEHDFSLNNLLQEAKDPQTTAARLAELAQSEIVAVREAVSEHPSASPETIYDLAGDEYFGVRYRAAQHPVATPETLYGLAADESESIREAVAEHPNSPPEALQELSKDNNWEIRKLVASHPHASPETFYDLAGDLNVDVRCAVGMNPAAPADTVNELAGDEDWRVAQAANQTIEESKVTPTPGFKMSFGG